MNFIKYLTENFTNNNLDEINFKLFSLNFSNNSNTINIFNELVNFIKSNPKI